MVPKISPASVEIGDRLQLIYVKVSDLSKWERNPKKHDLPSLIESFKQHGFKDPPKWEDILGGLVEGNGRFEALQQMEAAGEDLPRGILKERSTGNWCAPVLIGVEAKSVRAAEAYAIDHNNLVLAGGRFSSLEVAELWDEDYAELVKEIVESGEEFASISAADLRDLEKLIIDDELEADPGPQIDKAEELREKWEVKSEQLWQLGGHLVICGDCTEETVVERLMGRSKVDMVFTDPPYNSLKSWNKDEARSETRLDPSGWFANDNMAWEDYWEFINKSFHLLKGHSIYICCDYRIYPGITERIKLAGYKIKHCIIWKKNVWGLGKRYRFQHEFIVYATKTDDASFYGGRDQSDVWEVTNDRQVDHNTPKPVGLPEIAIRNSSQVGQVISDFFLGSGTTLIACERLNRKCRGVEIEPKYVAVTLERWHQMTGKIPVLLNG